MSASALNLVLRFLLELAALAAYAYWGFSEFDGLMTWIAGLGAPVVVVAVWGTFLSPKARHPQTDPIRLVLEILVLGGAAVALAAAGAGIAAVALGALATLHLILTFVFSQRQSGEDPYFSRFAKR